TGTGTGTAKQIALLVKQLAQAPTPEDAHTLQERLETLRAAHLSPTTQLLVRRAEKDLTSEKPDDAVDDMGDALALQPDQAILWRTRAQMRLVAGNLKGAVSDLGEALMRDAEDAQSWSLLASVEEHLNDGQAALKAWQKATALNPMLDRSHKRSDSLRIKAFGQPT
ncbi:MAG: tetratricopeptide repeat protein, partial [Acetobacter sp.]